MAVVAAADLLTFGSVRRELPRGKCNAGAVCFIRITASLAFARELLPSEWSCGHFILCVCERGCLVEPLVCGITMAAVLTLALALALVLAPIREFLPPRSEGDLALVAAHSISLGIAVIGVYICVYICASTGAGALGGAALIFKPELLQCVVHFFHVLVERVHNVLA